MMKILDNNKEAYLEYKKEIREQQELNEQRRNELIQQEMNKEDIDIFNFFKPYYTINTLYEKNTLVFNIFLFQNVKVDHSIEVKQDYYKCTIKGVKENPTSNDENIEYSTIQSGNFKLEVEIPKNKIKNNISEFDITDTFITKKGIVQVTFFPKGQILKLN